MQKNIITEVKTVEIEKVQEESLKCYSSPVLTELGIMQKLTLGGTPGINDSGAPSSQNMPD